MARRDPETALREAMDADDRAPLLAALGFEIDGDLLALMLTHRSFAHEHGELPHNERLEFLGDAVLGIVVTEELYTRHPDRSEGELAKIRANVVNMHALAEVARGLGPGGLGAHLLLGRGEELTGGRDKTSILADGMEAVIGAVYLRYGLESTRSMVLRLFAERLLQAPRLGAALDWKTSLQELAARLGLAAPRYQVTATGPDHEKFFAAVVLVGGSPRGSGEGSTKKEAEQKAAEAAWRLLGGEDGAGDTAPLSKTGEL